MSDKDSVKQEDLIKPFKNIHLKAYLASKIQFNVDLHNNIFFLVFICSSLLTWYCFQVNNGNTKSYRTLNDTSIYCTGPLYVIILFTYIISYVPAPPLDKRIGRVGGEKRWGLWSGRFEEAWQNQLIQVIGSFSKATVETVKGS